MKKTLVAAITSALVIGAASTTFAAANPFSDVPTDHWAFDAVASLAQEGVIEGYGDSTFQGDAHITRYEMAQMVAKAMAKEEAVDAETRATIEKLAAEFSDELNNLGVRVSNLEKKVDNVKIKGLLRLDYDHMEADSDNTDNTKGRLRLELTAKVNDDWNVKGRIDYDADLDDNGAATSKGKRLYAEGPLFGHQVNTKVGRFRAYDFAGMEANGAAGMFVDTEVSGAEFAFGNKLKTTLTYGRLADDDTNVLLDKDVDYAKAEFAYDLKKLQLGAAYHHLEVGSNAVVDGVMNGNQDIWQLATAYRFDKNVAMSAVYAQNFDNEDGANVSYGDNDTAYTIGVNYKGAKAKAAGSYGAWIAYRQLGSAAVVVPTYDANGGFKAGYKGVEVGVDYMLDENILLKLTYDDMEAVEGNAADVDRYFARLQFSF